MASIMKDSGVPWIGSIPSHWDIGRTKSCYTNKKQVVGEDAESYERLALTLNGVIKRSKEDATGLQPEAFNGYQILRENELVFKLIDLENISTSRVGYSPYTGIVSPAYIVLKPRKENESKYGEYFFLSMWQREVFNHMGDDGVRSSLNTRDLLEIPYLLVPDVEKDKIVQHLKKQCAEIDDVIKKTKTTIEEYKKLKLAIVTETVTKGIRSNRQTKDSGYEFIGEIPSEWNICRLRNIGAPQNGISKGAEFFGKGYPFVSYGDVYKNYSLPETVAGLVESTEEERERYSVKTGDIFFTRTSETIEEVGFSCVCEKDMPDATFAGFLIRVRPFTDDLYAGYSKYYFRSNHHRIYLVKEMNLVTRASLGQDLLKSMPVLVPPMDEQKEIAEYLDKKCAEIDTLIAKKTALLEEMESYKKSVIYEYVTGKKEVQ